MNFVHFASAYLSANIVVTAAFVLGGLSGLLCSSRQKLNFQYILLVGGISLAVLVPLFSHGAFFEPPAKIWTGSPIVNKTVGEGTSLATGYLQLNFSARSHVRTDNLNSSFWFIFVLFLTGWLVCLSRDASDLRRLLRKSFLIRKFKSVRIYASDNVEVPFSLWIPRRTIIVVPNRMAGQTVDLKIALLHEIQHHRQKDTFFVYIFLILRVFCFLNPLVFIWTRKINEIQEYACDEALVDRRKISPQSYANCLLRVVETAVSRRKSFVCATGLTFSADRHSLKRRINMMFSSRQKKRRKFLGALIVAATLSVLTGVAVASQSLVQDRRVSLSEATEMLSHVKEVDPDFHVVLNDSVLAQLNYYIGTPEGRDFMRASLERLESYRPLVERKIAEYNLPKAFIAIPLTESGYQNLPEASHGMHAAGLWQFVPSTAHNFGLRIEPVDDRMNVDLETDAAMRYLSANRNRFKSAELSVLAYNAGERTVQNGIDRIGSRDVWTLIRSGFEGDKNYIPKLMAAIIIKDNPEVLR